MDGYKASNGQTVAVKGAKGFRNEGYNVKKIGDGIRAFLFRKEKVENGEVGEYIKAVYPKVMAFFKEHDLEPSVANIKLNAAAIRDYADIDSLQKNGLQKDKKRLNKKKVIAIIAFVVVIIIVLTLLRRNP